MFENISNPFDQFEGRPMSAFAVGVSAMLGSAFNLWGAFMIFDGVAAWLFLGVMTGIELLAFLSLKHIVTDRENHHYKKANLATLIFVLAVIGCATMGHRAFTSLSIDIEETNKADTARADRVETEAKKLFAQAAGASDEIIGFGGSSEKERLIIRAEKKQAEADAINLSVKKKEPLSAWLILCLLALNETVKCGGRFAVATPTTKTWSPAQRKAHEANKAAKAEAPKKRGPRGPYKPRKTTLSVVSAKGAAAH